MLKKIREWYGPNFPFFGGNEKILSMQKGERIIMNDIKLLLFTIPGERINRPDFGTPLRSYVFEEMTSSSLSDLRNGIWQAISIHEPRVNVVDVIVTPQQNNNIVNIKIIVNLRDDPSRELTVEANYRPGT